MNTFDDKLFSVVKQVQDHENDITGTYTKEEVDGKLEEVKTEVTDTVDSKVASKADNLVQVTLANNKTGQYVVMCHKQSAYENYSKLVKILSFVHDNVGFNCKVLVTSRGSMGTTCGIYDVVCNSNDSTGKNDDTTGTKRILMQHDEKLYIGNEGIYVYSESYIQDVIVSGFISSVDDIQFINDTPENLDLDEIPFE